MSQVGAQKLTAAMSPSTRPPRLDSLSGIWPVASFMVFSVHVNGLLGGALSEVAGRTVGAGGYYTVTFFFVLSRSVLTWTAHPDGTVVGFWRRRCARIYPVYLVTFLVAIVISGWVQGHPFRLGPALASLFLVQSWFPTPRYYFSFNGVAWALSCEAFFYFVFPPVIGPLLRLAERHRRVLQLCLLSGVVALATAAAELPNEWLAHEFPVTGLLGFLLGCTVAIDVARDEVVAAAVGLRAALVITVVALGLKTLFRWRLLGQPLSRSSRS